MFFAETVCAIALAGAPRLTTEESLIMHFHSDYTALVIDTSKEPIKPNVVIGKDLREALAEDFATVPQVRNVLVDRVDEAMLVWIVADNPERPVRDRIFQKQLGLMDAFPEIDFDFNLIPSMGRPIEEIVTAVRPVYSRMA